MATVLIRITDFCALCLNKQVTSTGLVQKQISSGTENEEIFTFTFSFYNYLYINIFRECHNQISRSSLAPRSQNVKPQNAEPGRLAQSGASLTANQGVAGSSPDPATFFR